MNHNGCVYNQSLERGAVHPCTKCHLAEPLRAEILEAHYCCSQDRFGLTEDSRLDLGEPWLFPFHRVDDDDTTSHYAYE